MKPVIAIALLTALATAASCASADEADGAKLCAAASTDFPQGEAIPVSTLKARLAALGIPTNGMESVDSSCGMTGLSGMGGMAALPTLNVGSNNGVDVALTLQVSSRGGECVAVVVRLDGC